MKFSDMDMLQDYEKDCRMAAIAYTLVVTEILDPDLRKLIGTLAQSAARSQEKFANLILRKGDRP
ncbi:coat F domain-containing protein [Thermodesulfitimonas autotrophica]|uniref:Coat F domain-containing protein n=1 Tax=Thermodesulfitimonas autotrophica TaxID=1894989 RepID=A0A3N5B126_9THEO|nr:spore coat protein [Thermodesulfitimonas autotrophica]RPF49330.1 coat F domain-containing protein [Thermodesulfitimonas autotrophica]